MRLRPLWTRALIGAILLMHTSGQSVLDAQTSEPTFGCQRSVQIAQTGPWSSAYADWCNAPNPTVRFITSASEPPLADLSHSSLRARSVIHLTRDLAGRAWALWYESIAPPNGTWDGTTSLGRLWIAGSEESGWVVSEVNAGVIDWVGYDLGFPRLWASRAGGVHVLLVAYLGTKLGNAYAWHETLSGSFSIRPSWHPWRSHINLVAPKGGRPALILGIAARRNADSVEIEVADDDRILWRGIVPSSEGFQAPPWLVPSSDRIDIVIPTDDRWRVFELPPGRPARHLSDVAAPGWPGSRFFCGSQIGTLVVRDSSRWEIGILRTTPMLVWDVLARSDAPTALRRDPLGRAFTLEDSVGSVTYRCPEN